MHKSTTSLRFFLYAAVLVCGAHTASAAPLVSITPAASNLGFDKTAEEGAPAFAKNFSGSVFNYAGDRENIAADNTAGSSPLTPEHSSLALLGAGVLCIAGLGRRLVV